jgi:hypothetical protein
MFHTEEEKERDRLFEELRACVEEVNPRAKVFCQRACANLYHDLLGDWRSWKETTPIENPSYRPIVMEKIRRLLYWEKA